MNFGAKRQELRLDDFQALSLFLKDVYSTTDPNQLPAVILKGIHQLIPGEHLGYNEINSRTNDTYCILHPFIPEVISNIPALEQHFTEHPVLENHRKYGNLNAQKITDFLSQCQFRQLGIYQDFYRNLDTEYQLSFFLTADRSKTTIGVAINRKNSDFTERDRTIAELLRPHLIQARQNALAFANLTSHEKCGGESLEQVNTALIVVDHDGKILLGSNRSSLMLIRYFPGFTFQSKGLPVPLYLWMIDCQNRLKAGSISDHPLPVFTQQISRTQLVASFYPTKEDECRIVLKEMKCGKESSLKMEQKLTQRELEIMHWVVEGKTNVEIGLLLERSPRTVDKHLEHIFAKLMVPTRGAAIREFLKLNSNFTTTLQQ